MKKIIAIIICIAFASSIFVSCASIETSPESSDEIILESFAGKENKMQSDESEELSEEPDDNTETAVYLGVEGYGTIDRNVTLNPDSQIFRFEVDGEEKLYKIDCGIVFEDGSDGKGADDFSDVLSLEEGAYPLHNLLKENYQYKITVENETVTDLVQLTEVDSIDPVICGIPGERTLKNFLLTAFEPLGTTLYVYGGGWDYQDVGGSYDSTTIGLSPSWNEFFESNDVDYMMRDEEHPESTTFPYGSWNEYYYAGLDCSGYVGWVLYNTMYDESFVYPSFVKGSSKIANSLDEEYFFGTLIHESNDIEAGDNDFNEYFDELEAGDVVSTSHHVYIVVGKCDDGSVIIINSTNNESLSGKEGGGVQLGVLSPDGSDDTSCEAFILADEYTKKYYPEWAERYPMLSKNLDVFFDFPEDKDTVGIFHWDLASANGISDPDGYADMTAEDILEDIFHVAE